jgi:uncharacterized membrane protein YeaQ/YmgE (transglycosylase-associated protein family)
MISLIEWLILGLVAGFIGSKIVNKTGEGLLMDTLIGVVGAVVGGWLVGFFHWGPVTGLNLYSLLVAVIGSIVCLLIYRAVRSAV